MQAEHITGRVVSTTDSAKNNVSPIVGVRPVDHVVLPIDSDIEAGQWQGGKMTFPLSRKGNALTMNKIDLPVECGHGDPLHLADPAEGYLIDEKTEGRGIFVGLSVSDRRW